MESTRARVVNLTRKISQFGIVVLTALLPLMFLPFTAEFFEFNKSVLFLGIMLVVLVSWLINLAFTGTVSFWKTSFDTWIFGFFAAALIALFFSQDKVASLIGFSGRMSEGILVLLFLVSMSFIVRQVVTKSRMIEMLVWSLLVSGALLGVLAVAQYAGVYIFSGINRLDITGIRTFTPLGTWSLLPFYLAALVPVGVGFLISNSAKTMKSLFVVLTLIGIMAGFVVSAGSFWSWPGVLLWVMVVGSAGFVLFMAGRIARPSYKWLIAVGILMAGLFVARNIEAVNTRLFTTDDVYYSQPQLQYDAAWRISASTLSQSPVTGLFGSGPDTFAYDFTMFRPAAYNATANWNVRFTRSSSQILEMMGNIGIIGLIMWLALASSLVVWLVKTFKENHENPYSMYLYSLGAGILVIMVSGLITFYTINMSYLLWLFMGMVVAVRAVSNPRLAEKVKLSLSMSREKISVEEHDILPYVMLVPALLLFVVGTWQLVRLYRAEVYYQDSQYILSDATKDADPREVLTNSLTVLGNAINEVSFRDSYHADYGVLAVNLLREYSTDQVAEGETDPNQTIKNNLLVLSTKEVEKSTELNPINVRNWESRAYVYQELAKLTNGGYGDALLASINQALQYDPVKPDLYHQKGVILSLGGLDDDAVSQLKTALQLQPLLLSARYDLAMQYQKMERLDEAKTQLQFILDVLKQNNLEDSDAYTQVQEAMDAVETGTPVEETAAPEDGSALDVPQEDVSVEGDYNLPADTTTDTPTGE